MTRPSEDEYYLGLAAAVSARGECLRRQVGCVIVKDRRVVSTGYNGAPPGEASCLQGACPRASSQHPHGSGYAETGCVAIHAETNAIIRGDWLAMQGATAYISCPPCTQCAPLLRAAGIERVVTP